jgi:hypothetical protein
MVHEDLNHAIDDVIAAGVIVDQIAHQEKCVQMVIDEAGHHGSLLGWQDPRLALPIVVIIVQPEVIKPRVNYGRR